MMSFVVIFFIAKEVFDERVGLLSAALFAVYPSALWHSDSTIWHNVLSALLVSILILYFIYTAKKRDPIRSILCGLLMGFVSLTNPVIIAFYPFYILYLYLNKKDTVAGMVQSSATTLFFFVVTISPWVVRNYLVMEN